MPVFNEIWKSLTSWGIWLHIGLDDVIGRYRRTILGPFWIVISQCAFIFGIYYLRHSINGSNGDNFLLYLAISVPAWNFVSGLISEAPNAILRSKGYIESYPLPIPIFFIRPIVSGFVNFVHVMVVYVIVAIFYGQDVTLNSLMLIPGMFIIIIFGFGINLIFGMLGARFRDLGPAIGSILQLMFILTPVFWQPSLDQINNPLIKFNPLYYLIEIIRQPLLSNVFNPQIFIIAFAIAAVTFIVGIIVFKIMRPKIVYWL